MSWPIGWCFRRSPLADLSGRSRNPEHLGSGISLSAEIVLHCLLLAGHSSRLDLFFGIVFLAWCYRFFCCSAWEVVREKTEGKQGDNIHYSVVRAHLGDSLVMEVLDELSEAPANVWSLHTHLHGICVNAIKLRIFASYMYISIRSLKTRSSSIGRQRYSKQRVLITVSFLCFCCA